MGSSGGRGARPDALEAITGDGTGRVTLPYRLRLPKREKVYLIALFGKREQSDLSPAGRKLAAELVKQIKEEP
jgi:hypothetical protein